MSRYHIPPTMITFAITAVQSFRHRICVTSPVPARDSRNFRRVQDIADSQDNTGIKYNCQYNREDHHFTDFFKRNIDFLCCLRDNIKTNKEKRCDNFATFIILPWFTGCFTQQTSVPADCLHYR